jgi:glycosyltransferase involved in cell wall biosynthesis
MRVLHLVPTRSSFFDQQVRRLRERGVDSTVLTVPGEFRPSEGVTRSPVDYAWFIPQVVREAIVGGDYDLVHANSGLTGPAAIAQGRLPVVMSLWGMDLVSDAYHQSTVTRLCASWADAVVVMSDRMNDHLDRDATVVPHGVDLDLFEPTDPDAARAAVGWESPESHVLFPYPPERTEKRHDLARRVVDQAADRLNQPVNLQTVYDEPHEKMPEYLNAADVLLLPSESEGSPNAVKEALACNLPVVATDVGDVRDRLDGVHPSFVRDDESGLVEATVRTLEAGPRSNGRDAVRELSVDRTTEKIEAVYRQALSTG